MSRSATSVATPMYRVLFWMLATVGKPVGGIPPRRVLHWLARRAYGNERPRDDQFRWHSDRWGNRLLLHPHYLVDYRIIAFGAFEDRLHRFIDHHVRPGMVCFDVGAHIGSIALHLARRAGSDGSVYCFEPVQRNFDQLGRHIEANRFDRTIRPYCLALSNKTGTCKFSYAEAEFANQGMASLVICEHPDVFRECQVPVITLDEFVERHQIARIDFVKVDIQGAEPLFIEGGRRTLARLKPLMYVEVSPHHLGAAGSTSRSLLRMLEDLGYDLFELRRNGRCRRRITSRTVPDDYASPGVCAMPRGGEAVRVLDGS